MQYLISYYNRHHYGNNEKNRIARCYRDEDARGDRQPEFTQIDMEMSFISRDDVLSMTEGMMAAVFKDTMGIELRTPFPRIACDDAIEWYGSDKPELRFDMKMQDGTFLAECGSFQAFKDACTAGGTVKVLVVPGAAEAYSRKKIEELESKSMQIFAELIPGYLLGNDFTSSFTIRINDKVQKTKNDIFKINEKITMQDIVKACNFFFKRQFEAEYNKFYAEPVNNISKILELKKIIDSIKMGNENQFLIRMGRWSQVEYVILGNDFRNPKVPVDRRTGREKGFGNTRTLLNYKDEYIPMGWCLCTLEQ